MGRIDMDIQSAGNARYQAAQEIPPKSQVFENPPAPGAALDIFDKKTGELQTRKDFLAARIDELLKDKAKADFRQAASIYGLFLGIPAAIIASISVQCVPGAIAAAVLWVADAGLMLHFAGQVGKCVNALRQDALEYQQVTRELKTRSDVADLAHSASHNKDDYAVEVGDDFVQIDGVRLKVHKLITSPFHRERKKS